MSIAAAKRQDDLTAADVRELGPWEIKDYVQAAYDRQRASAVGATDASGIFALPKRVARPRSLLQRVVIYFGEQGLEVDERSLRAFVPVGRKPFANALKTLLQYGKVERHRVDGAQWLYREGNGVPRRPPKFQELLAETIPAEWYIRQCRGCGWLDRTDWSASAAEAAGEWACGGCGLVQDDFELPRMWLFDVMELDEAVTGRMGGRDGRKVY